MWYLIAIPMLLFIAFIGIFINRNGKHSSKHEESEKVLRAFYKNGACEVWQEFLDKKTLHHLVDLGDGTFGDYVAVMESDGTLVEKTILIPKTGKYQDVVSWLKRKSKKIM